jgi:hypothetical protein
MLREKHRGMLAHVKTIKTPRNAFMQVNVLDQQLLGLRAYDQLTHTLRPLAFPTLPLTKRLIGEHPSPDAL